MTNAVSVDVEDYHNVLARHWLDCEGPPTEAVVRNTHRLLEAFAVRGVRATFFVLGEVAETFPELIRDIAAGGHELGVHGYYHNQVFRLTPEKFRDEVYKSKALIEDIAGVPVDGHRAPAFSITPQTSWALDVVAEVGFRFDSSVFPIAGRRYGWPGFRTDIHKITLDSGRTIIEVPLSTISIAGVVLPVCGGGYLRHFPLAITRWAIRRIQRERPAIVYVHPYDIEVGGKPPDISELSADKARRVRRFHRLQVRNRHTVEKKILRLLDQFQFAPIGEVIKDVMG